MRNKRSYISIVFLVFIAIGCGVQNNEPQQKRRITMEDLISANRKMVERDADAIKEYIQKSELKLVETKTGLWYHIDKEGEGLRVNKGDVVEIAYSIALLDSTLCYTSDSLGNKTFKVGQGGVESGLEEGILLLKEGSEATFIMPPHRAYGLVGDDDKIPARATLLYKVKVLGLKEE